MEEIDELQGALKKVHLFIENGSNFLGIQNKTEESLSEDQLEGDCEDGSKRRIFLEENQRLREENGRLNGILQEKMKNGLDSLVELQASLEPKGRELNDKLEKMVREITDAEKEIRKLQQEEEVLKEENQNMVEEMKETRKMCELAEQQLLKAVEEIEKVLISQIDLGGSLKLREELNSCQREAERLRKDKSALEQEIENRLKNTEKKIKQKSMEEELLRIDYQNALASTVYQQGILPLINEPKETKKEAEKENQAGGPGWTFDRLARKEKGSESLKTRNNGTGKGTIATKDKRVKKNECQESLVMDLDMFGGKFA